MSNEGPKRSKAVKAAGEPDIRYDCVGCCEPTRNVDRMFRRWAQDKQAIIDAFADPSRLGLWSILSHDRSCLCRMGTEGPCKLGSRSRYRCAACQTLNRLIDLSRDRTVDTPFTIECGRHAGTALVVRSQKLDGIELRLEDPDRLTCWLTQDNRKILQCDDFTHRILASVALDSCLEKSKIPTCVMYTGFVCGNTGYWIEDAGLAPITALNTKQRLLAADSGVRKEVALQLLKQLVCALHCLKALSISIGRPCSEAIAILDRPCTYEYRTQTRGKKVHVDSPITIVIAERKSLSMDLGAVRLQPRPPIAWGLDKDLRATRSKSQSKEESFLLVNESKMGVHPTVHSTVDFFCLLIAMVAACPPLRIALCRSDELSHWFRELLPEIDLALPSLATMDHANPSELLYLLRRTTIRPDALEQAISTLPQ
jgi:hypothetical protein